MTKIKDWLARNLLCRTGTHRPPDSVLFLTRWVTCRRCGTPLS